MRLRWRIGRLLVVRNRLRLIEFWMLDLCCPHPALPTHHLLNGDETRAAFLLFDQYKNLAVYACFNAGVSTMGDWCSYWLDCSCYRELMGDPSINKKTI